MRELLNFRDAFNLVAEYIGSGEPITEALIREQGRSRDELGQAVTSSCDRL